MRLAVAGVLLVAACALTQAQDRRTLTRDDAPSRRLALVIGNDTYARSPLQNARNDARAMSQALRNLAFEVTVVEDGNRAAVFTALLDFGRKLTGSDLGMVFFAGHGLQVEGVNYLLPVDFDGRTEDEVRINAISSDELTRILSRARVGVLVLDACRDNPFTGQRSGSRGLAQLEAKGMVVAFATGAGQTASDGQGTSNGVFTTELVKLLGSPGLGLRDTFFEVQRRVQQSTNGAQFPAVYSQLINDVVLTPGPAPDAPPARVVPAPVTAPSAAELALRVELQLWESIRKSSSDAVFRDYLNRYPNGSFRAAAEDRIRSLAPPLGSLTDPASLTEQAPAVYRVRLDTTAGPVVIEVTRAWAPIGADRFYNLVKHDYYSGNRFIGGTPATIFGIHGDPAIHRAWVNSQLPKDPVRLSNKRGYVAFTGASAPTASTAQILINTRDNPRYDAGGLAPIGVVVSGMDIFDRLKTFDATKLASATKIYSEGNTYLQREFPNLDYIRRATIEP